MKQRVSFLLIVLFFILGTLDLSAISDTEAPEVIAPTALGAITLNSVPATFNFGANQLSTTTITKTLPSNSTYTVSISDLRVLVYGYSVTVSAPALSTSDGKKLHGSNIQMKNGNPALIGTINPSILAPQVVQSFYADQVDGSGNSIPTKVIITPNAALNGILQWDTSWNGSNIILTVQPAEALARQYTTTITWTLSDTP